MSFPIVSWIVTTSAVIPIALDIYWFKHGRGSSAYLWVMAIIIFAVGSSNALVNTSDYISYHRNYPNIPNDMYTSEYMNENSYERLMDYTKLIDSMSDEELVSTVEEIKRYNDEIDNNVQNPEIPSVFKDNPVIGYLRIIGKTRTYRQPIVSPEYAEQYPYCATLLKGSSVPIGYGTPSVFLMESSSQFYPQYNLTACTRIEIVIMEQKVSCDLEKHHIESIKSDEIVSYDNLPQANDAIIFIYKKDKEDSDYLDSSSWTTFYSNDYYVDCATITSVTNNERNHNNVLSYKCKRFEVSYAEEIPNT